MAAKGNERRRKPGRRRVESATRVAEALSDPHFLATIRDLQTSIQAARVTADARDVTAAEHVLRRAAYFGKIEAAQVALVQAALRLEDELARGSADSALLKIDRERRRSAIETRLHLLRRLNDSMLWDLLGGQLWIFRRLATGKTPPSRVRSSNIEAALEALDWFCRAGPLRTGVLCDLTTFVEVGDVLGLDFARPRMQMTLIEAKDGALNHELLPLIDRVPRPDPAETVEHVRSTRGSVAADQVARMLRQQRRLDDVTALISNDRGTGHEGTEVLLSERPVYLPGYERAVIACIEQLVADRSKLWAIENAEECAFVGAYRGVMAGPLALRSWMQAMEADGPVVEVTDGIFGSHVAPIFSTVPTWRHLGPLLSGEIRVFIGIDLKRFPELAEARGFSLRWDTGKRARKQLSQSTDLLRWNGAALVASADGSPLEVMVGTGVVARIAFGFTVPSAAVSLLDPRKGDALLAHHGRSAASRQSED